MRWAGALLVTIVALALAAPAGAARNARFGIQDDAWLMYGPGTLQQRLATIDGLGAGVVRFTLRWDQVAPTRPADPRNPGDAGYRWGVYGDVLDALHANGRAALVTLYGSPGWANGGHGPNWLPSGGFADFAYAASKRFPWVRMWTVWNEPNTRTFSVPVSPSLYVRTLLNPGYAALHAASRANRVAGGVTSPRQTPSGMSPSAFLRGMRAAHARLDAYAQNPYPMSPHETPFRIACDGCDYFTLARLATIRADVTRAFGPKPIWLTEWGYQTNPPDPLLGVSDALQARYLGEAALRVWEQPGATMLIQFLVQDQPNVGDWQSGLLTVSGAQKPSFHAFALPLAERSRRGPRAVLWGQVRPGTGRRAYVLQRRSGGAWRRLGGVRRTGADGTFELSLPLARGTQVRIWAAAAGWASPPLTVT